MFCLIKIYGIIITILKISENKENLLKEVLELETDNSNKLSEFNKIYNWWGKY